MHASIKENLLSCYHDAKHGPINDWNTMPIMIPSELHGDDSERPTVHQYTKTHSHNGLCSWKSAMKNGCCIRKIS